MKPILSYLIYIVIDDSKLSKLLHLPRYIIKLIEIDWQRCLIDYRLHAGDSEAVVIGVVKSCIHHPVLTEAEYLPVNKWANLAIPDGADEAFALQVDSLKHASGLIIRETDPCGVIEDLCQFILMRQIKQCSVCLQ